MNADERRLKTLEVVRVPGSSSAAALTDSFTSSNLLFILFIIGRGPAKACRARNTRAKSLALIGSASGRNIGEQQSTRAEALSIRRLEGSRWQGGRVWSYKLVWMQGE